MNLLDALGRHGIRKIVFSSSAMVYDCSPSGGKPPFKESAPQAGSSGGTVNPYARGKQFVEEILGDMAASPDGKGWGIISLRYFYAGGAHPTGRLGEDPTIAAASNELRNVVAAVLGKKDCYMVCGSNYDTPDGTCVRDYVHVMDLADAHLAAVQKLATVASANLVYNLGSGAGVSDLEVVAAMEATTGLKVTVKMAKRRPGDVAAAFVDPAKANKDLGWTAKRGIDVMCKDLWRWSNANPSGYVKQETTFGAFKQASFQTSSMPKFSSSYREGRSGRVSRASSDVQGGGGGGGGGGLGGLKRMDTMEEMEFAMGQNF